MRAVVVARLTSETLTSRPYRGERQQPINNVAAYLCTVDDGGDSLWSVPLDVWLLLLLVGLILGSFVYVVALRKLP